MVFQTIEITPEMEILVQQAIDYAFENPSTEKEIKASGYGVDWREKTPNILTFTSFVATFTVEEREGIWWKHLSMYLDPKIQNEGKKLIAPNDVVNWAKGIFGFRIDGEWTMYVSKTSWNENLFICHIYESVA